MHSLSSVSTGTRLGKAFGGRAGFLGMLVCSLGLVGCAKNAAKPVGTPYVVTAGRTLFYRVNPAYSTEADAMMVKGQTVLLVRKQYGYSQVRTADGQQGYVATADLVPAPPPTPPPLLVNAGEGGASGRLPSKRRRSDSPLPEFSNDPLFDVTDIPIPIEAVEGSSGSKPAPAATPAFRANVKPVD